MTLLLIIDVYCMHCVIIFSFRTFAFYNCTHAGGTVQVKTIHEHVSDFPVIYGSLSNTLHLFPSFANGYSDRTENLSRQKSSKYNNFYQTTISTISGHELAQ